MSLLPSIFSAVLLLEHSRRWDKFLIKRHEMFLNSMQWRLSHVVQEFRTLKGLCDYKRSYAVPPEFCSLLNTEERFRWSPTDTEVARVFVSLLKPSSSAEEVSYGRATTVKDAVSYAAVVERMHSVMLSKISKPHIYRSLRVILRHDKIPERGGKLKGFTFLI